MAGADMPGRRLVPPADGWPAAQVTWVVRRVASLVLALHAEGRRLGPIRAWDLAVCGDAVEPVAPSRTDRSEADDAAHVVRLARSILGVHPPSYLLARVLDAAPEPGAGAAAVATWLACFDGLGPEEPPQLAASVVVPPDDVPAQGDSADRQAAAVDVVRSLRSREGLARPRLSGSVLTLLRSRRPGRVFATAAAVLGFVGVLAAGAVVGARSAGSSSVGGAASPAASLSASPASELRGTDWRAVIASLDATRDQAFQAGDVTALGSVYVAGSPPELVDRRSLADLVARGLHAVGLHLDVQRVLVLGENERTARLHVVDRLPAYTVVDVSGRVVARQQGRGETTWNVELQSTAQGWRIAAVAPVR